MPWGAVIGSIISSESAADSSDEQRAAGQYGVDVQNRQYRQVRADQAPWREAGTGAVNRLAYLLGVTPSGAGGSSNSLAAGSSPLLGQVPVVEGDLLMPDRYGNPGVNRDLYDTNTIYARAYDQATAEQNAENQMRARQSSSVDDANGWYLGGDRNQDLERRIRGYLPSANSYYNADIQAQQQAQQAQQDKEASDRELLQGQNDFGALTRQFTYDDFMKDPVTQASFQFGLDEGRKGIEARFRASGLNRSGAVLKDLTRFGTDYGAQRAGESFNRFQSQNTNTYNRLAGLAGLGQASANQTSVAGQNNANQVSNLAVGMGNAQAASTMHQGNVWGNLAQGLGNYWNQQQQLNQQGNQYEGTGSDTWGGSYLG